MRGSSRGLGYKSEKCFAVKTIYLPKPLLLLFNSSCVLLTPVDEFKILPRRFKKSEKVCTFKGVLNSLRIDRIFTQHATICEE